MGRAVDWCRVEWIWWRFLRSVSIAGPLLYCNDLRDAEFGGLLLESGGIIRTSVVEAFLQYEFLHYADKQVET